jgi:hypothetical protein
MGIDALFSNSTGNDNTATGGSALNKVRDNKGEIESVPIWRVDPSYVE